MDRYDLYELCVTDAPRLARFAHAAHGGDPRILREDFCGSGALARSWPRAARRARALAVDLDPEALRRAAAPGVRTILADVRRCSLKADIIAATNFPLGYFHQRDELLAYLRHARTCLRPGGILLADLYGGRDALTPMRLRRRLQTPSGTRVDYVWHQAQADPLTNLVTDTLSFTVRTRTGRVTRHPDAFVYRWRLWSIPELRDAAHDAGFREVDVYTRMGDAVDSRGNLYVRPHEPGEPIDENYVVYVVARGPRAGRASKRNT